MKKEVKKLAEQLTIKNLVFKRVRMKDKRDYVIMKFDTWRKFYEPFKCSCCGKEISKEQFCFSTLCPYCDLGRCQRSGNYEEGHGQKGAWKNGEIVIKLAILEALE